MFARAQHSTDVPLSPCAHTNAPIQLFAISPIALKFLSAFELSANSLWSVVPALGRGCSPALKNKRNLPGTQLASNRRALRSLRVSGENVLGKTVYQGMKNMSSTTSTSERLAVLYIHPPDQTHEPFIRNS